MSIDARDMALRELFVKLREIMYASCGKDVAVDILIKSYTDAGKVTSFASMSGCRTSIEKKGEYCIVHISGHACCV
jgi:hypothetical protein